MPEVQDEWRPPGPIQVPKYLPWSAIWASFRAGTCSFSQFLMMLSLTLHRKSRTVFDELTCTAAALARRLKRLMMALISSWYRPPVAPVSSAKTQTVPG